MTSLTSNNKNVDDNIHKKRIVVVGRGMIGSSLYKYLCKDDNKQLEIFCIGPNETKGKANIFGAWYDEGRITRCSDPNITWATLAKSSIEQYRAIENESNIKFYHEVGHLVVGSKNQVHMKNVFDVVEKNNLKDTEKILSLEELKQRYPYANLNTKDNSPVGLLEKKRSGHISPRKFVEAQCKIGQLQNNKSTIINKKVIAIRPDKNDKNKWCIEAVNNENSNDIDNANIDIFKIGDIDHIVIAAGAWMNFRPLLYNNLKQRIFINIQLMCTQVSKFEISIEEAKQFDNMPSLIYKDLLSFWAYVLPPIMYPDKKVYMKIGGGYFDTPQKELKTENDVIKWYQSKGDQDLHSKITTFFYQLFPNVKVLSSHSDSCITCHTKTKQLFIGPICNNTMSVACGGNGYAAKSADAIGKLASDMVLKNVLNCNNAWDDECIKKFKPEIGIVQKN